MTKSQGLVLSCVQSGFSDERAIVVWTALTIAEVRSSLRELADAGLVKKWEGGWIATGTRKSA